MLSAQCDLRHRTCCVTMWCLWCVYPSRPHPCCCCCTHIGAKKEEVTYYLMAAGPNWEEHAVLNEVEIQEPCSCKKINDQIIKDDEKLPKNAMLISPDRDTDWKKKWNDISSPSFGPYKSKYNNYCKTLNFVAITNNGERENE
eukprot:GHVU01131803.1.p1 GENE.GHVU01131803.1~~GHVU01131803.1.p1  ORF type:complete len:143 (-),score=13.02 GHVU01131803.1:101-529(-)